ncbi:MAG: DGQHR domain-containing protein [bacterium]|nr:DGQHR domain-containing protein [bacterium]
MEVFPGIRAEMGRWEYYIVRMSMREVAENVEFASDAYDGPRELADLMQRTLSKTRSTQDIAQYLAAQEDRFFSSLVIAAVEGNPNWYPVTLENVPEFKLLQDDQRLSSAFGVLTLDGSQRYYALDGQHRLAAIRSLIKGPSPYQTPSGFATEDLSVLLVVPQAAETRSEFLVRYRRLFGNLNRYAKPTAPFENIAIDEDDPFAIITRRLVRDHEFFSTGGSDLDSTRVRMSKGKNVGSGQPHFTSLVMLYDLNKKLLASSYRRNRGWGANQATRTAFERFRPPEDQIDELYDELVTYWEALFEVLPVLRSDPTTMRDHAASRKDERESPADSWDCILFWPIGQQILVDLARKLLDRRLPPNSDEFPVASDAVSAVLPLSRATWDAHAAPTRHVLLVLDDRGRWKIASENRKVRIDVLTRIYAWQIGLDDLSKDGIFGEYGLKKAWEAQLPVSAVDEQNALWDEIETGVSRGG